jgi:hypothetical protein
VIGAFLFFSPLGVASADVPINKDEENVAIGGYDTVAYFTEGRAVKGSTDFVFVWHKARWLFSSDTHRDQFVAAPERYAPQFGGLCASAMTRGVEVKADPEAWAIVDGKLYMNVTKESRDRWRENPKEKIQAATEAWESVTSEN